MKIIAGEYKGRTIEMPEGIRPTSDKVREALFEILKARIEGARFLDLYCGSGAIGIEALSRGAKKIAFVDNDHGCISILKKNLAKLGLSSGLYDIYSKDCIDVLCRGGFETRPYDIVFIDPPYYKDIAKNTLLELSKCDILTKHALVIVEAFKKDILPDNVGDLTKYRSYQYGDTKLEFYRKAVGEV